jgi:hypothetical protein
MKKVSIRQPILDAIEETDVDVGRNMPLLLKWAKRCEISIGSALGYKRRSKAYTVTGGEITLPDECLTVFSVLYGDYEDVVNAFYKDYEDALIQSDAREEDISELDWQWRPMESYVIAPAIWEQYGNVLNLIDDFDEQEITIQYSYLEQDDRGYYLVNESHVEAIKKFIILMVAKKYGWSIFKSGKLYRNSHQAMVIQLDNEYKHAMRNARATDGAESEFEKQQY